MRDCRPSNKPGTCLWCGRVLGERFDVLYAQTTPEQAVAIREAYAVRDAERARAHAEDDDESVALKRADNAFRLALGRIMGARVKSTLELRRDGTGRVGLAKATGEFGQDGRALFCTRSCGEAFGVSAARNGYRFKPSA